MKAGHTFVSNGPSLLLSADGKLPGTEIIKQKGSKIELKVKANSNAAIGKITRVAIYNNDGMIGEKMNLVESDVVDLSIDHSLQKSQWIAALVYCDNGAVAHTTPVYVIVDGKPTWDVKKGPEIINTQLNGIKKIEQEENEKVNPDQGILERLHNARQFYNNLLSEMNRK